MMVKALPPEVKADRKRARALEAKRRQEAAMRSRLSAKERAETLVRLPIVAMQPSTQYHHSFKPWDNIGTQCLWCWGFVDDWRHLAHPTSA